MNGKFNFWLKLFGSKKEDGTALLSEDDAKAADDFVSDLATKVKELTDKQKASEQTITNLTSKIEALEIENNELKTIGGAESTKAVTETNTVVAESNEVSVVSDKKSFIDNLDAVAEAYSLQ